MEISVPMRSSFDALADANRRQILETLADGEIAVSNLLEKIPLSQPAISHHLNVLRKAQLVHVRVDGQRRLYSLNPVGFHEVDRWMAHMEMFWTARLGLLEQTLRDRTSSRDPATQKDAAKRRSR
jgi:DNA-binding transcriptional ArsR family regulator